MDDDSAAAACDVFPFAALPRALALQVFAALPADTRLRCAEVCKPWCAALADVSLWTRLDLSAASGVAHDVTPALLRAAAAKARGALTALDVSGCAHVTEDALLAVAAANAGALTELCASSRRTHEFMRDADHDNGWRYFDAVQALLRAAPALRLLDTDLRCESGADDAQLLARALRNEGVFGFAPLRVRSLALHDLARNADAQRHALLLRDVTAALATHASLTACSVYNMHRGAPALDAVVDALCSHPRLRACRLWDCRLDAAALPALLRLAGAPALRELAFDYDNDMHDADAARLGAALRANASLTCLLLDCVWAHPALAAALLGALTAHGSLRKLGLSNALTYPEDADAQRVAGDALGALLAADAPALRELELCEVHVYEEGLEGLCDALPRNTHLRTLIVRAWDEPEEAGEEPAVSEAYLRRRLLPAVRANASLTRLEMRVGPQPREAAREAEQLVQQRRSSHAADARGAGGGRD
jgi:hypothetical protein